MSGPRRPVPAGGGAEPSATVAVRVQPRSSRNEVSGLFEGVLRVRLTAPAVENRANEALVRFLAEALDLPRARVEIVSGDRGRNKIVRVHGIAPRELYARLGIASEQPAD